MIMKTGIFMLLLTCIFIGSSCEKDDDIRKWSKITALKNGEPWEAKGTGRLIKNAGVPDRINLRAIVATSSGHWTELLVIEIPKETGKYELKGDPTSKEPYISFYHMEGDDALGAVYETDKEADNFIEIESINLQKMEITGIFKASFLLTWSSPWQQDDPPAVSFTDGRFRLRIEEFQEDICD
jgi:hypothetical protein